MLEKATEKWLKRTSGGGGKMSRNACNNADAGTGLVAYLSNKSWELLFYLLGCFWLLAVIDYLSGMAAAG